MLGGEGFKVISRPGFGFAFASGLSSPSLPALQHHVHLHGLKEGASVTAWGGEVTASEGRTWAGQVGGLGAPSPGHLHGVCAPAVTVSLSGRTMEPEQRKGLIHADPSRGPHAGFKLLFCFVLFNTSFHESACVIGSQLQKYVSHM